LKNEDNRRFFVIPPIYDDDVKQAFREFRPKITSDAVLSQMRYNATKGEIGGPMSDLYNVWHGSLVNKYKIYSAGTPTCIPTQLRAGEEP
jgi:hypothetical protein